MDEKIIPDDKTGITAFSEIENEMKDHLRLLITKPIENDEIKPFKDLKMFNKACLDLNSIESIGSTQVLQKISQMGGWPVLNSGTWDSSNWTWQNTVAKLRENGYSVNYIFSYGVSTNYRNNTFRNAWVSGGCHQT